MIGRAMDWMKRQAVELQIRLSRKRAFAAVLDLDGPNGVAVERYLAWMRDYCFAERSTAGATPEETARNNGRREVWLAMNAVLQFDPKTISDFVETHEEFFGDGD